MQKIENKIRAFAHDQNHQNQLLALMVVCRDKGRTPNQMMAAIMAAVLLEFHGIPTKPNG
jgi:hypothetical protein